MNNIAADLRRGCMDAESKAVFAKYFSHVAIEPKREDRLGNGIPEEFLLIEPVWRDVDRPTSGGLTVGIDEMPLALRLMRAMESGATFCHASIQTDCNNKTYVSTTSLVLGRRLNADLKKLGY